jgi:hypothetical protein
MLPNDYHPIDRLALLLSQRGIRILLFLIGSMLLVAMWPFAQQVSFQRKFESLLPQDDPAVESFLRIRDRLGGSEAVLMVYPEPNVLDPKSNGLQRLKLIDDALREAPEVEGALSLVDLSRAVEWMRLGGTARKGNDEPVAAILASDPLAKKMRELFEGYTHSFDGNWVGIAILLKGSNDAQALERIRTVAVTSGNLPREDIYLVGEPVLVAEGTAILEHDAHRLARNVAVLLSVTLFILLRRFRWVFALLAIVFWSRWMTQAILNLLGIQLSMVSGMLDAVLTVIAVAAAMHIPLRNDTESKKQLPEEAAKRTWCGLLGPIFWSLITTGVGFASLASSEIVPVRQFGWMMGLGTMLVLVGIVLLSPFFLAGGGQQERSIKPTERLLKRGLLRLVRLVHAQPWWILGSAALLALVALCGITRLKAESNFLRNFRAGHPLVKAYEVVEANCGGAGVWDVMVTVPEKLDNTFFERVLRLETELREVSTPNGARLTKVLSIADVDAAAKEHSRLLRFVGTTIRVKGMREAIPAFVDRLIGTDKGRGRRYMRILLRSAEDLPADEKQMLISQVEQVVLRHTTSTEWLAKDSAVEGHVTGYYVLISRFVGHLLVDQWTSFGLAAIGVFLCVWFAIRSWRLAFAACLPTIIPILVVIGTMGLLGLPLNFGAAMIAAVSVGLSIDGSIHYLMSYQRLRRAGRSHLNALHRTQCQTGLAVTFATIALAIGLLTLISSPLKPIVVFGALTGITLVASLLGNLLLLPAALSIFADRRC